MRNYKTALWAIVLLITAGLPAALVAQAPGDAVDSVTRMSMQVWALQALHDLDLDAAQLQALRAAAAPADHPTPRAKVKATEKYVTTMQSLREALLRGNQDDDDDRVDELRDQLDEMRDDEDIDIDDHVSITDAARAKTPDIVHLIRPSQLAGYFAAFEDEVPDPVQSLLEAADQTRHADGAQLSTGPDKTAHDVGILVGGLDLAKATPVEDRARQWIEHCRVLTDAEFKAERPALEKSAKEIVGDIDPFLVLRHWVERDVAELLSNPQLGPAIDAKLAHVPAQDRN